MSSSVHGNVMRPQGWGVLRSDPCWALIKTSMLSTCKQIRFTALSGAQEAYMRLPHCQGWGAQRHLEDVNGTKV